MNNMNDNINSFKIGIVGVGMVGGALQRYLEGRGIQPILYDKGRNLGSPSEINQADIIFVCVPTPYDCPPPRGTGKGFDLSCIEEALNNIQSKKIVVIKSTVLPGTTEKMQEKYPQHKILFNPEFLTEATADQDMCYPDRQIVGYTDKSFTVAGDLMQLLPLAPFERIIPATEAETVKYFGNTWFSVKVSFANQVYDLCKALGIDYERVMESAAADKRIGRTHLNVWHKDYRGYGGKCLPKDIKAFIQLADEKGVDLKLHKIADQINEDLMKQQNIADPEKFSKRD